ncbi:MAG: DMT family transporter [Candidatus Hydrogenedentota bacterium]
MHVESVSRSKFQPAFEMFAASFAFATMSALTNHLGDRIPWALMAFFRIAITFVIAFASARALGIRIFVLAAPVMWLRSIAGTFGLLCTFHALTHMPVTDAVTLLHTRPIWVAMLLAIEFRRLPGPLLWCSLGLGIAGVYVMERPTFDEGGIALWVALAGAVFSALSMVSLRNLGAVAPLAVVVHFSGLAAIISAVVAFTLPVDPGVWTQANAARFLWLVPIGLFGTLGQVLLTRAYGKGETHLITVVGLCVIGWAALYDYLLSGRTIAHVQWLGILLIIASILISAFADDSREERLASPAG